MKGESRWRGIRDKLQIGRLRLAASTLLVEQHTDGNGVDLAERPGEGDRGTVVAPTSRSVPSTTGAARPVNVAANFGPIS